MPPPPRLRSPTGAPGITPPRRARKVPSAAPARFDTVSRLGNSGLMAASTGGSPPLTPQALTELLESAIVAQEWQPGEKLPSERRLAERYGVSRPVVREALRRLTERSLIAVPPGRGSYVRRLRATEEIGRASL